MELNRTLCYRALKSRDVRFDGRFFTGVRTTGIYCRPICPARTPKLENIAFYSCPAAAEEAGFRPCLRCRPETAPGTPAWAGTSTTVTRALRLIDEGVMDEHGVEELARRLGVGARHLRRLFDEHLGASPVSVAQSRRLLFAKKLIDETSLPLTQVAFASGYSSLRRFNAAFQRTYRMAPRDLRRVKRRGARVNGHTALELKLAYRPPFDWEYLTTFLGMRAIPGVESVVAGAYRRSICVSGEQGVIEVADAGDGRHVLLRVPVNLSKALPIIVERTRRVFDLKADPEAIAGHLGDDWHLRALVRNRPGLRVPGAWDAFEISVRAVLGQQVSVKGATTLCGRLVDRYGEKLDSVTGTVTHLFPAPERLIRARMNGLGITGRRIETIRQLARAAARGDFESATPASLEEAVAGFVEIPGIGEWTAQYIAMRALGEPDAFLSGDLGLQKASANGNGTKLSEKKLLARAEAWRPWRAYAAMHLWASLAD